MTVFVDASALVAIIRGEPKSDTLADVIENERQPLVSTVSVWETIAGLCRTYSLSLPVAEALVEDFLHAHGFRIVDIGERELGFAIDAHARFGKGRHPAKLNMGDCFAYACARANHARLLYTGDDFSKTDIG